MAVALAKKVGTSVRRYVANGTEYTAVKYHQTEIVIFSDKGILLDTGGWETATTKRRMNQVSDIYGLGFHVYTKGGILMVDFKGESKLFSDAMVLTR